LGEGVIVFLATTIVAVSAMLLVFIPCTPLLRIVLARQDLRARDPVFFFKACEAMFFGSHGFFEEDVVWTWKS